MLGIGNHSSGYSNKEAKHLGLQQEDQDSSSTQSTGQSHHEATAVRGTNSQDQCISSESVQDGSYENDAAGRMKPVSFMGHRDSVINPSQINFSQSINCISYPYADSHCGGLFTTYGPQAIIQPQMVGMAPARVALPLDLAEDCPIYVNAKQYHGILRRRKTRAKLEARNKLLKPRRPYLHESRHQHALNRVRGSGGRFLSTKKLQQPDPSPSTGSQGIPESIHLGQKGDIPQLGFHQSETGKCGGSITSCSGTTSVTNSDVVFQLLDHRFSTISPHLGIATEGGGGLTCNRGRQFAPVIR